MGIPAHVRWPALIIGALVVHVVVSLVTVWVATSNPSYAVEEDYYDKAVHWDARRAQERRNVELGWQLSPTVIPPSAPGMPAIFELTVVDRDGHPVDGATVSIEAFHNARADNILRTTMEPNGQGRYAAPLPMRRSGVWEIRITATRGEDTFTHRETRFISLSRSESDGR